MTNIMRGTVRYRPVSGRRYVYPSDVNPPELPWLAPDTDYRAPSGGKVGSGTLWDCPDVTTLTNAIANASPGDTIKVHSGTRYLFANVNLPNRDPNNPIYVYCSKLLDGSWSITPTVYHIGGTQTRGVRVEYSQGYETQGAASPFAQFILPATVTNGSIIATSPGSGGGWRFEGIEFMAEETAGQTTHAACELIRLGMDASGNLPTSITQFPRGYHFGHCFIHGNVLKNIHRGVTNNAGWVGFRDCYICNIQRDDSTESQGVGGWAGPGVWSFINCFLSGGGETTLFGGGFTDVVNMRARNFTYKWCNYWKDSRWFPANNAWSTKYGVKNNLEHKNGSHILIEDCVFDRNAAGGQNGSHILVTPLQDGIPNWLAICVSDVTVRNARVKGGGPLCQVNGGVHNTGFASPNQYEEAPSARILFSNILGEQIGNVLTESWSNAGNGDDGYWGIVSAGARDVTFEHCSLESNAVGVYLTSPGTDWPEQSVVTRLTLRNNVLGYRTIASIWSDSGGGTAALDAATNGTGWSAHRNVFYYTQDAEVVAMPSDNAFGLTPTGVGFDVSYVAHAPSALAAASTYKGYATDGSDPGADVATLNALATALRPSSYPTGATP